MSFDRKETLKEFRKLAKNSSLDRCQYLAYAFLRGTAYIKLERKINEDKFVTIGRYTFLHNLSYKILLFLKTDDSEENKNLKNEIEKWIFKKYAPENQEAA